MSGTRHPIYGSLPWHCDHNVATGKVFERSGREVARVCFIPGNPIESIEKEEAIARLIAAAPELAEALRNIVYHSGASRQAADIAIAALAKLEGSKS